MHCCAGDSALSTNMVHTDLLYCDFSFLMWSQLNINFDSRCNYKLLLCGLAHRYSYSSVLYTIIIIMHVQT